MSSLAWLQEQQKQPGSLEFIYYLFIIYFKICRNIRPAQGLLIIKCHNWKIYIQNTQILNISNKFCICYIFYIKIISIFINLLYIYKLYIFINFSLFMNLSLFINSISLFLYYIICIIILSVSSHPALIFLHLCPSYLQVQIFLFSLPYISIFPFFQVFSQTKPLVCAQNIWNICINIYVCAE